MFVIIHEFSCLDSPNDVLSQYPPTNEVIKEYESKFVDADTEKDINSKINNANEDDSNILSRDYENIKPEETNKNVTPLDPNDFIIYVQQENDSNDFKNVFANYQDYNAIPVYVAGTDYSIRKLKEKIGKCGEGHELIVYFYLYKDKKYYDLGYLYTDANILKQCIINYKNYFCIETPKNNWCFDHLSKYTEDFTTEAGFQKDLNEPVRFDNLTEYLPIQVAGHYEFSIPNEKEYKGKDIVINLYQNAGFGVQNTTESKNIIDQGSILKPKTYEPFRQINNNNGLSQTNEDNKIMNTQLLINDKAYDLQDVTKLRESTKIDDDILMNTNEFTIVGESENRNSSPIKEGIQISLTDIKQDGFTADNANLVTINGNDATIKSKNDIHSNNILGNMLGNKDQSYLQIYSVESPSLANTISYEDVTIKTPVITNIQPPSEVEKYPKVYYDDITNYVMPNKLNLNETAPRHICSKLIKPYLKTIIKKTGMDKGNYILLPEANSINPLNIFPQYKLSYLQIPLLSAYIPLNINKAPQSYFKYQGDNIKPLNSKAYLLEMEENKEVPKLRVTHDDDKDVPYQYSNVKNVDHQLTFNPAVPKSIITLNEQDRTNITAPIIIEPSYNLERPQDSFILQSSSEATLNNDVFVPPSISYKKDNLENSMSRVDADKSDTEYVAYITESDASNIKDQTIETENYGYNSILLNRITPAPSQNVAYTTTPRRYTPISYFSPTLSYQTTSPHNLNSHSTAKAYPNSFNTETLEEIKKDELESKRPNIINFYDNNIQSRLKGYPMYQVPVHKIINYDEFISSTQDSPKHPVTEKNNQLDFTNLSLQAINSQTMPPGIVLNYNKNYIIKNQPSDRNICKNEVISPDYLTLTPNPKYGFGGVYKSQQKYFQIPSASPFIPISSSYIQPRPNYHYFPLNSFNLLPIEPYIINLKEAAIQVNPLNEMSYNNNIQHFHPLSIIRNLAHATPSQNIFIPKPSNYLPVDSNSPEITIHQSNSIPIESVQYLIGSNNNEDSKDILKYHLQPNKQNTLTNGFRTASIPESVKAEIESSINKNIIDLNKNYIKNKEAQTLQQPSEAKYYERISPIGVTSNFYSLKQRLPKYSRINIQPVERTPTFKNFYNTDISRNSLPDNVIYYDEESNIKKLNAPMSSSDEKLYSNKRAPQILLESNLQDNQDLLPNDNSVVEEYQVKMLKNVDQGQHKKKTFNVPKYKQNYIQIPSQLHDQKYLRLSQQQPPIPTTFGTIFPNSFITKIMPLNYQQDQDNSIPITPSITEFKKPTIPYLPKGTQYSNYYNLIKPLLYKTIDSEMKQYEMTSTPTVYENIYDDISAVGSKKGTNINQLLNMNGSTRKLYSNLYPPDSRNSKTVNSENSYDIIPDETVKILTRNHYIYNINPNIIKMPIKYNTYWPVNFKNNLNLQRKPNLNFNIAIQTESPPLSIMEPLSTFYIPQQDNFYYKSKLQSKEPSPASPLWYTINPKDNVPILKWISNINPTIKPQTLYSEVSTQPSKKIIYSNIPNKNRYILPILDNMKSRKQNILISKLQNVLTPNNLPPAETYYEIFNEDPNHQANNIQQTPSPVLLNIQTPNQNIPISKLHNNMNANYLTLPVAPNPIDSAQNYLNGYPFNFYPQNINSYVDSTPKVSKQEIVSMPFNDNNQFTYLFKPKKAENFIPEEIATNPFSTVTEKGNTIYNPFSNQRSYFTQYTPTLQSASSVPGFPSQFTKSNKNPTFYSFIPKSIDNIVPIKSMAQSSNPSDSSSIESDQLLQNINPFCNTITQNTGAFQRNAFPMLLPPSVCQTNLDSIPMIHSKISFTNEAPPIRPLLDFSSEIEPHSSISNKTSSVKPNIGLANLETSYSLRGEFSFVPQINSHGVSYNILPVNFEPVYKKNYSAQKDPKSIHSSVGSYQNNFNIADKNHYHIISDDNLQGTFGTHKHHGIFSPTCASYKTIEPYLNGQFADFNYAFNIKTKPLEVDGSQKDTNNLFYQIVSPTTQNLPLSLFSTNQLAYYTPYKTTSPDASNIIIKNSEIKNNIYKKKWLPLQWNLLNVQSDNTLTNTFNPKSINKAGIEYTLLQPQRKIATSTAFTEYLTGTQNDQNQSGWQTPVELTSQSPWSKITSQPCSYPSNQWYSYTKLNQPITIFNPLKQYTNSLSYNDNGNPANYAFLDKQLYKKLDHNLLQDQKIDLKKYKAAPVTSKVNQPISMIDKNTDYFKSEINFDKEKPLQLQNRLEYYLPITASLGSVMNKELETQINDYNLKDVDSSMANIVIAKYEPSLGDSFTIKTDDNGVDLKAWRSKLKIFKPRIVYDVKELSTLNFMPVVKNSKYSVEDAMELARCYVTRKYGNPIIIKGVYSFWKPYAVIYYNSNKIRIDMPVLWPTLCSCGCCKSGCNCINK